MTEEKLIAKIAHLWIENGGDAEGLSWCWERIRQAVQDEINSRQASVSLAPAAQVQPLIRLCPKCGSDVEFSADDETALCENCGAILNVDLENDYEISVIA